MKSFKLHNIHSSATLTPAAGKSSNKGDVNVAQGLRELFEDELKKIYWAEKALIKTFPKLIEKATSEDLISVLEDHLELANEHVERCELAFKIIEKPPRVKKCKVMSCLIKEAQDMVARTKEGMVRDEGIISAVQKIEHFEIAGYGTLCAFAKTLEESKLAELLDQTLNEEIEVDQTLTGIAMYAMDMDSAGKAKTKGA